MEGKFMKIVAINGSPRKNGNTANGIEVVVPVKISKTLNGVQITLKADVLDKLVSSGVKRFIIDADRISAGIAESDVGGNCLYVCLFAFYRGLSTACSRPRHV